MRYLLDFDLKIRSGQVWSLTIRQLVILYFSDYRIAGVVPCTENVPEDEITKHSHAWIYNGHFNESETGQIGNLGWFHSI